MLRYRVAVMLLIFFFLGMAAHGLITFDVKYVFGILALVFSYITATTINDIADRKIDEVNHPKSAGRPLVNRQATENDLKVLNLLSASLSLFFGLLIGPLASALIICSLALSYLYSLKPFIISHRTHFAHFMLSIAYVAIPYSLGVTASGYVFGSQDLSLVVPLMLLFFGRILLKDFRDRKGDAKFKKPTFLLKYGKTATCLISAFSILLGNIGLLFALRPENIVLLAMLQCYFICIYIMAYRLWKAKGKEHEQVAIGIGAKMGNSFLLNLLGLLILAGYNAPVLHRLIFTGIFLSIAIADFALLLAKPGYAIIGYRG